MGNYQSQEMGIPLDAASANAWRLDCIKYLAATDELCSSDTYKNHTAEACHTKFERCCRDFNVCPHVEWYMYAVYSSAACFVCLLVAVFMWFTWQKMVKSVGAPRGK